MLRKQLQGRGERREMQGREEMREGRKDMNEERKGEGEEERRGEEMVPGYLLSVGGLYIAWASM